MIESLENIFYLLITNTSIISFKFYFYFFILVLAYYTIGKKFNFQWALLLFFSLFFYLANGRMAALWMFLPIILTYLSSILILKINGKKRTLLSVFTLLFNVLFLIYFKEANFFIRIFNRGCFLFGLPVVSEVSRKAPFGISYLSLMLISYFLDSSWGIIAVQKNPFKFLVYIIFFPITSSGPITRYSSIRENLFIVHSFDYKKFCYGCQRILWGFFKKMVIAERIAIFVNNVYNNDDVMGFVVVIGLLSFAFQLYFDFSGCMDMVIGVGQILGIEIPENFRHPFYATNLSEFWRCWHITLGLWVKDYVLYPVLKSHFIQNLSTFLKLKLGKKNRYAKLIPTWCGMFCTWFIVGFWHGGDLKYVLGSGLFFFIMISLGQLFEPFTQRIISLLNINIESKYWILFQRFRTLILFAASISFDRANNLKHAFNLWNRALIKNEKSLIGNLLNIDCIYIELFICFVLFLIFNRFLSVMCNKNLAKPFLYNTLLNFSIMISILIFGVFGTSSFIYFNF